ncbi:DMT family transporter [Alkalibacillus aidingensis]|uniref:DMT family transporter n=1 Tax=Alkalibacillus aidingensis TaxID=2747607 RepID=UPI001660B8BE|nr:multidrug efflux SMR transporter [Alkalibacillus aidingensis]
MYWTALIIAGLFEMLGVLSINLINRYKNWQSVGLMMISFTISFICLSYSMVELPMSIAYSVWTGIGAAGGAIMGMILFKEPATILRILFIFCIISATIGLKLISP